MTNDTKYAESEPRIPIGVSSCLLGEAVRYDGGHKRNPIVEALGLWFTFCPFCPEVAIGLGVPREPIRLLAVESGRPRAVGVERTDQDVTEHLEAYARDVIDGTLLPSGVVELYGYVFKSKSPSCGIRQVDLFDRDGRRQSDAGRGVFAATLMRRGPELPIEDEIRLDDPSIREAFIRRVRDYYRKRNG